MAYIGFNPSQLAIAPFATKYFTGDGSTTTFTLDQSVPGANEANVEVFVENVQQNPIDAYTVGGALNNQLIFSEAPVSGAAVYVIHKGEATYNLQPSTGSVTAATLDPVLRNFTVNTFTGDGSTKTFTLTDTPYSPNSILVMVDGIVQTAGTHYNVSGTTLTFDVAPTAAPDSGSNITVVHLGFSSGNKAVMDASITPVKLSTGGPTWTTTGSVGIGASPSGFGSGWNAYQTGGIALWSSPGNTNGYLTANMYYDGTNYRYINNGYATRLQLNLAGGLTFSAAASGTAGSTLTYTEVFRTDATGQFGIGMAPPAGGADFIVGTSNTYQGVFYRATSGGSAGNFALRHSRGSVSSPTVTVNGDTLFQMHFQGYDGTNYLNGADIIAVSTGAVSTNSMPADLVFKTTADGANSATERMRIDKNGLVTLPYGQIKFPATQNASSDPNTLDDYEEGTWTPTFQSDGGTTGTTNVSQRWGRYQKIGRKVFVTFGWNGSLSGFTGTLYVGNLPFSVTEDTTYQYGGSFECSSTTATAMDGASFMFFAYSIALYPRFTTGQQVGYLFANGTQINGLTSFKGSMTYLTPN